MIQVAIIMLLAAVAMVAASLVGGFSTGNAPTDDIYHPSSKKGAGCKSVGTARPNQKKLKG
jgi:hypothetical protein